MSDHIIRGTFQSDKYPTCPAGKVPLSVEDKTAQPFLWGYAQVRREVDEEFCQDLESVLLTKGYRPRLPDAWKWRRKLKSGWSQWFVEFQLSKMNAIREVWPDMIETLPLYNYGEEVQTYYG